MNAWTFSGSRRGRRCVPALQLAMLLGLTWGCEATSTAAPGEAIASPVPGCTKDVECKGDRICERGVCASPPSKSTAEAQGSEALPVKCAGPGSVRQVDWLNRAYKWSSQLIMLTNGKNVERPSDEALLGVTFAADRNVIFGDVTGDGVEDALVWLSREDGGNDPFQWLDVYTLRDCEIVQLGVVPGDNDSEYHSIESPRIEGSRIVLERREWVGKDAHCCPTRRRTEYWQWNGRVLVESRSDRVSRVAPVAAPD